MKVRFEFEEMFAFKLEFRNWEVEAADEGNEDDDTETEKKDASPRSSSPVPFVHPQIRFRTKRGARSFFEWMASLTSTISSYVNYFPFLGHSPTVTSPLSLLIPNRLAFRAQDNRILESYQTQCQVDAEISQREAVASDEKKPNDNERERRRKLGTLFRKEVDDWEMDESLNNETGNCWALCTDSQRQHIDRSAGMRYNGTRGDLENDSFMISIFERAGGPFCRLGLPLFGTAPVQGALDYGYLQFTVAHQGRTFRASGEIFVGDKQPRFRQADYDGGRIASGSGLKMMIRIIRARSLQSVTDYREHVNSSVHVSFHGQRKSTQTVVGQHGKVLIVIISHNNVQI